MENVRHMCFPMQKQIKTQFPDSLQYIINTLSFFLYKHERY
jgi:hypothetical protein